MKVTDAEVKIAEKVKFWEEQDKINKELIPRVIKNHELISEVTSHLNNYSDEVVRLKDKIIKFESELQKVEYLKEQIRTLKTDNNQLFDEIKELHSRYLEFNQTTNQNKVSYNIVFPLVLSTLSLIVSVISLLN